MAMGELTIQTIVRNEPFVYYAIKSVYDFADVILLYDTGSTDDTLDDIAKLLTEDYAKKIRFKHIPIIDETRWRKFTDIEAVMAQSRKNFEKTGVNMASLRRQQITETQTEFFLLLDGDEVCFTQTIEYLRTNPISTAFVCSCMRRDWYIGLDRYYTNSKPVSRLFRTDSVDVVREYPDEYHCHKISRKMIKQSDRTSFTVPDEIPPIAHFEPYLKPFRRRRSVPSFKNVERLPEVMQADDRFTRRLEIKRLEAYQQKLARQQRESHDEKRLQADESVGGDSCVEQPPHS